MLVEISTAWSCFGINPRLEDSRMHFHTPSSAQHQRKTKKQLESVSLTITRQQLPLKMTAIAHPPGVFIITKLNFNLCQSHRGTIFNIFISSRALCGLREEVMRVGGVGCGAKSGVNLCVVFSATMLLVIKKHFTLSEKIILEADLITPNKSSALHSLLGGRVAA